MTRRTTTRRASGQAATLDREQWAEVLGQATPRDRALVRLQLSTLGRISEVVGLRWSDLNGAQLHLQRSKGGPPVLIDLPAETLEALTVWRQECPTPNGWIFPGQQHRRAMSIRTAQAAYKRLSERTGFARLRTHSPRRSAATIASREGHSLRVIQEAGNWRSLSSLQRYLDADPADVASVRSLL